MHSDFYFLQSAACVASDPSHLPTVLHPVTSHLGWIRVNTCWFAPGLKRFLRDGPFKAKAGNSPGKLGPARHPEFILLTAVGIQDGHPSSERKHLLSFLKFSTAHALFTILLIVHHHLPCSFLPASIGLSCFWQYVYIIYSLRALWVSRFYWSLLHKCHKMEFVNFFHSTCSI